MNAQRLREIGEERGAETARKDAVYNSAFQKSGEMMAVLFPNGVPPGAEQMTRAGLIFRTLDKLCREAQLISSGEPDAFGENPWQDAAGYAILGTALCERTPEAPGAPTWETQLPRDSGLGYPDESHIEQVRYRCATAGCVRTPGHWDECLMSTQPEPRGKR